MRTACKTAQTVSAHATMGQIGNKWGGHCLNVRNARKSLDNKDRDALLQMRIDAGTAQTLENLAAYLSTIA